MEPLLILTNLPDAASAENLARALIDAKAAACVNILSPCRSVYRWNGQVETAAEIPMLIKTTAVNFARVEALVGVHHPYEVPELVAVPITKGLPAYLAWLASETREHD